MKRIIGFAVGALALVSLAIAADKPGPTDAQIAAIVVTANQVDIDAGEVAKSTSKNADVKGFAERMIADHKAVNQQAKDLVTRLKVTPEENDTSKSLTKGGDDNLRNLKALKGADFDRAYIDHEVTYHQDVIDALDKTLIPNAKNKELKDLLVNVRPSFEAHLAHAKEVQAKLGKPGA
jgi:putative membrane protein